ncbi:hypothetical protein GCM10007920_28870 [Ciceribacter naphthalenivorans]|uniref:Arginine/ornithine antiporter n=2 Tax=Alphaproteobacteria TaxID=28211 RepID=A0A512HPJ5_9HYPH|nr:hypothetical protein RNA01_43180 [Ciceribacter naphthalenivorans]GLR23099.1 hypothetical protein GCM10007920_28870 [Ciceribacter naphthalenivorans]GLT05955.1 hypothetical protein GCM10007926_28870 [Sphingomonas psychrolutea]
MRIPNRRTNRNHWESRDGIFCSDQSASEKRSGTLGLLPLVALVVGSMIGGGVFSLPQNMAKGASPGAVIIGWLITGIGMLALAFVYQGLI